MKKIIYVAVFLGLVFFFAAPCMAQSDNVPEEGGLKLVKLTNESTDFVLGPQVNCRHRGIDWWTSSLLSISPDGSQIAYLALKNEKSNIMLRSTTKAGATIQRTFRDYCNSVNWSADGEKICFGELKSGRYAINMINAIEGGVLQQISTGNVDDYAPRFTADRSKIFFSRQDMDVYNIWSYDFNSGLFTNYSPGITPYPIDDNSFLCARFNTNGGYEIWKVNFSNGSESMILGSEGQSFSTPILSPDKKWILCVGVTQPASSRAKANLDIYVVKIDGSGLTQLTFHPGNDASPVWSHDGKEIYFLSQRGTQNGAWNIWKMIFPY